MHHKECPDCNKKVNVAKTSYCPSCGRELFTPVIDAKWNYKIVAVIFIVLILLYIIYLLIAPDLYTYLDKV